MAMMITLRSMIRPHIYDKIISAYPKDENSGMIPDIRGYYEKEIKYDTGININNINKEI